MHVTSDLTSGSGIELEPRFLLLSGHPASGLWDHSDAELESWLAEARCFNLGCREPVSALSQPARHCRLHHSRMRRSESPNLMQCYYTHIHSRTLKLELYGISWEKVTLDICKGRWNTWAFGQAFGLSLSLSLSLGLVCS